MFNNIVYGSPQTRTDAWELKFFCYAGMLTSPENQSYQQYSKDILASNAAFATAAIATVSSGKYGPSSYPAIHGLWYPGPNAGGVIEMFEVSYILTTAALAGAAYDLNYHQRRDWAKRWIPHGCGADG